MSSPSRFAAVVRIAGLAGGSAYGAELAPAIESEIGYDSNNEGRSSNEDGQARTRTMPEISLRETLGRLAFDAKVKVAYDNALNPGDPDDYFDQFGDLGVVWDLSSRTQLSLSNTFARVQNIDRTVRTLQEALTGLD